MISLIIEFALFFLVLFVLVPGMMISLMLARDLVHQQRKPVGWHKTEVSKLVG